MNNYKRGRDFEQRTKEKYKAQGYTCVRSAASKSPFDLVCINPEIKIIALVQCKNSYMSPKESETIKEELRHFEGIYTVRGELALAKTKQRN